MTARKNCDIDERQHRSAVQNIEQIGVPQFRKHACPYFAAVFQTDKHFSHDLTVEAAVIM